MIKEFLKVKVYLVCQSKIKFCYVQDKSKIYFKIWAYIYGQRNSRLLFFDHAARFIWITIRIFEFVFNYGELYYSAIIVGKKYVAVISYSLS